MIYRLKIAGIICILLAITALPGFTHDLDCETAKDMMTFWFEALDEQLANYDALLPQTADLWQEVAPIFSDYVLNYANLCLTENTDFQYRHQYEVEIGGQAYRYRVRAEISSVDVNLDNHDEWLIRFHVGDFMRGQGFLYLMYRPEDHWQTQELWGAISVDETLETASPWGTYIHEQADIDGYTYMGLSFSPLSGYDPYIGGLRVLRWKDWQYEEVIVIPEICAMGWKTAHDGSLYIETTSSVPQQGCTVNHLSPKHFATIPGAQMELPTEG